MGGSFKYCVEIFFSHSAENNRRGISYCCSNVGYRKCLDKKGEYQEFPSKFFCLLVPKIFLEESFTVAVMPGTGSIWIRRGSIKNFRPKYFVSECRKKP